MTKKVWMGSAIVVVATGVFLGTIISENALLNFLEEPVKTQTAQVETAQSPWLEKDSLFTTKLSYSTPAGTELNTLSIGVEDDTVTSFSMSIETKNDVSIAYQKKFVTEIEKIIIGKPVSQIAQLDTIAGATITTQAFTDAFKQF